MDITLEGLLVGIVAIAIGLAFCFYGFNLFLILLPIWGFFAGFLLGANVVSALLGGGADPGFLATVTGWVVGFIVGLVFAVLSYLYYWVAVILLGGALGYQLTYGVLEWLNIFPANDPGLVAFILALIVGAIFAVGFFLLQMPAILVIVATAISGAGAAVAGLIVALGLLPRESLNEVFDAGIFGVYTLDDLSWLWLIIGVALAIAGAVYQSRTVADMTASIRQDSYRNPGATPPTGAPA
jgi:hypothetical protein